MTDLIRKVENWGHERQLTGSDNIERQTLKVVEEAGELAKSILTNNKIQAKDDIGDITITLINLAKKLGTSLDECLKIAFAEIEHRQGQTINGNFEKWTEKH